MTKDDSVGYNERLFSGKGLRNFLHSARYRWCRTIFDEMQVVTHKVLEIGCFDGKFINYLVHPPERYVGIDAGWEGGIDIAEKRFADNDNYQFIKADNPNALDILVDEKFDLGVAMETLEHVPPAYVDQYLSRLSRYVDGYIIITVPNEKGIVLLGKWFVKKIGYGDAEKYTLKELIAATFGRMDLVERTEHKGFDYMQLVSEVERHFDIVKVESIPFKRMPLILSFNVGILAKTK